MPEIQTDPNREIGCAFCEILEGERESFIFEETGFVAVLLSLEGHPLIVSRSHLRWPQVDEDTAADFGKTMVKYMRVVERGLKVDGVNVFVTKGRAAGQEIAHAHMHVIPREYGDQLGTFPSDHTIKSKEVRTQIFNQINTRLQRV